MKKFLYLRVNAIIGIAVSIISFYYTITTGIRTPGADRLLVELLFVLVYGLPLFHNLFVVYIYQKYYPEGEIGKPHKVINLTLSILCLLDLLLLIAFICSLIIYIIHNVGDRISLIMMFFFSILSITMLIQVIGGFRLIKVVKKNVRLQLIDSFE
jgi:hypothetical protein